MAQSHKRGPRYTSKKTHQERTARMKANAEILNKLK
jgi:hypothetical protein